MFVELRELLHSGAIRKHQLETKDLLTPTSLYPIPGFLSPGNIKRAAQSIQAARKVKRTFAIRVQYKFFSASSFAAKGPGRTPAPR